MKGTSLKPCTTASLCIRTIVSCWLIFGMASHKRVGRLKLSLSQITRKVLCATVNRAVGLNAPRTTDADKGGQAQPCIFGARNEFLEHLDQFVHGLVTRRLLVGVSPLVQFPQ